MSRRYTDAAARLKGRRPIETWVLRTLAEVSGPDGRSWFRLDTLADKAHVSARAARQAIKALEAAGLVEVTPQPRTSRGFHRPAVLRLTILDDDFAARVERAAGEGAEA